MTTRAARLMTGVEPGVPGLLGLPRDYLNAQLGSWNNRATPLTELEVNRFREKSGQSGR